MHLSDKDTTIFMVHHERLDEIWDDVKPFLIKTLKYSDCKYDVSSTYNFIKSRDMQLWVVYIDDTLMAYTITQIIDYPCSRRLVIPFVGGKHIDKWLYLLIYIIEWGKKQSCEAIEGYGRPGWKKILQPFGVEKIHDVYRIKL